MRGRKGARSSRGHRLATCQVPRLFRVLGYPRIKRAEALAARGALVLGEGDSYG